MRAYEFIIEGYPEAQAEFAKVVDPTTVTQIIQKYRDLVNKNQVQGNDRNIDWWRKQGWDAFNKFVDQKSQAPTTTQQKRSKLPGRSINLVDNANWLVVIPVDKEASCFHGKGSDWCTTKPYQSYFEQYFYDNSVTLVYCLNKQTAGMWAIAAHKNTDKMELFDQRDNTITPEVFQQQTGFDPEELRTKALGDEHQPHIEKTRDQYRAAIAKLKLLMTDEWWYKDSDTIAEIEKLLAYTKSSYMCYNFITHIPTKNKMIQMAAVNYDGTVIQFIEDPTPDVQIAAVKNVGRAISYIDNPTLEVQMVAVKNNGRAILYIKNPVPEIQIAAVKNDGYAIKYIENPSPELQMIAVKNDGLALEYIEDPSPELQMAAVKNDGSAIHYIEDPSPELQMAAVKNNPFAISEIENPTLEVQMAAVNYDATFIQFIIDPTLEVQMAAVKRESWVIMYIENPAPEVVAYAKAHGA